MRKIKCNKCGRTLEISDNQKSVICRYCGSRQVLANQQAFSQPDDESNKNEIYNSAKLEENVDTIQSLESAIKKYSTIIGWKDANMRIYECQKRIEEIRSREEQAFLDKEKEQDADSRAIKRNKKRIPIIVTSIITSVIVISIIINTVVIPNIQNKGKYDEAVAFMNSRNYNEAIEIFSELGDYKDSAELLRKSNDGILRMMKAQTISLGVNHMVGIKSDGTVVAVGDNTYGQCDVEDWRDIVSVAAGADYTVGLKADGTVVASGNAEDGKFSVVFWKDIVSISAKYDHTIGLKSDGTVVAVGNNEYGQCDVERWKDIVDISTGDTHTVGLKSDGTVVSVGNNEYGQCDVERWKDIVEISAGFKHTVGLKSDGTVIAVGDNDDKQCNVNAWKDIAFISAGTYHTVGLKSDGTVVAEGYNYYQECDVSYWQDIVEVLAGNHVTVGLKTDGTLLIKGYFTMSNSLFESNSQLKDNLDEAIEKANNLLR